MMRPIFLGLLVLLAVGGAFFVIIVVHSEKICSEPVAVHATQDVPRLGVKTPVAVKAEDESLKFDTPRKSKTATVAGNAVESVAPITTLANPYVPPTFYNVDERALSGLDQAQQEAIVDTMNDYINFNSEWNRSIDHRPERWNSKMREMEQEITLKIGPDAVDKVFH